MPRADLMSMKKCEDERIYYRNGVLLKNPSRRIEAGSIVDRLNEHLVQDDDVPRVLSTRALVFQPEHEDSVIEDEDDCVIAFADKRL